MPKLNFNLPRIQLTAFRISTPVKIIGAIVMGCIFYNMSYNSISYNIPAKAEAATPALSSASNTPTAPAIPAAKAEATPATPAKASGSIMLGRWFNDTTGQMHWDRCQQSEVAKRFISMFKTEDEKVLACVTLNYENGTYMETAVAPCWSTNTAQAKARTCDYASDNSMGVDAGLFMINTWFQATRITKLGGPACLYTDSKDPKDPCNVQKIAWLHNMDNQNKIIMDIYNESGFELWVAYVKHVKPYLP